MIMDFEGKTAVITGASSGIGHAIALDLLRRRTTVHLLGRTLDPLPEIDAVAAENGAGVHRHRLDLGDEDQIVRRIHDLTTSLSSLDFLIHSAGTIRLGKTEDMSPDDFDLQFRVNVRAPFLLTRGLLPLSKAARGQIVFINSSAAHHSTPNIAPYAASKAALRALADCMREEVKHDGIRVISIYPGRTASRMQEAVHRWESKEYEPEALLQPSDVSAAVMTALAAPLTAETTDIHIRPFQTPRPAAPDDRHG